MSPAALVLATGFPGGGMGPFEVLLVLALAVGGLLVVALPGALFVARRVREVLAGRILGPDGEVAPDERGLAPLDLLIAGGQALLLLLLASPLFPVVDEVMGEQPARIEVGLVVAFLATLFALSLARRVRRPLALRRRPTRRVLAGAGVALLVHLALGLCVGAIVGLFGDGFADGLVALAGGAGAGAALGAVSGVLGISLGQLVGQCEAWR